MLEGPYISYYENGQMFENENFMYDENHGRSINYYMDGKVMADVMYDKGEKVGIEKLYFPNGKIHSEQQFVLGVAHGSYKEYSVEGKLILTIEYYDGEIISVTKN
jgi:antitoxin component YwqK of YwqJK toxin-antitoxin module